MEIMLKRMIKSEQRRALRKANKLSDEFKSLKLPTAESQQKQMQMVRLFGYIDALSDVLKWEGLTSSLDDPTKGVYVDTNA